MADAAVGDADLHLAVVGRLDVDVVDDDQGLAVVLEQGGAHGRARY